MGKRKRQRAVRRTHPPALRIRADRRESRLPWPLQPVPWYPVAGWTVDANVRPSRSLNYAANDFYIQDAGSLLALAACGDLEGLQVCDLCAAPGGKATALAERVGPKGFLMANEPIRGRLGPLRFNLARTGTPQWAITNHDPGDLIENVGNSFDLVLVDAPCSGQALVGRGRQSDASFTARQIEHSAARQRRILSAAVNLVRPGGRLVYSTCTFAEAENENQVAWLLESFPEFAVAEIPALEPYRSPLHRGCYRLQPPDYKTDGAFAAVLIRGEPKKVTANPAEPKLNSDALPAEAAEWADLRGWLVRRTESSYFGWPASIPPRIFAAAEYGPELCYRTGRTWKPAHGLGLQQASSHYLPHERIELSDGEARSYVAGQPIEGPHRGWAVVSWQKKPLGWVKGDGNRLKNHLPPAARMSL